MQSQIKKMMRLQNKKKYNCSALWVWAIAILLSSCSSNVYNETVVINEGNWNATDSIVFDFEIQDTSSLYHVFLGVNHLTSYSYQNVYCLVESYSSSGLVQRQVASLELASRKGKWLGDCNDESCDRNIPFITNTKFDEQGKYKIVIKQYARTAMLEGINSLKLQIKKVKES